MIATSNGKAHAAKGKTRTAKGKARAAAAFAALLLILVGCRSNPEHETPSADERPKAPATATGTIRDQPHHRDEPRPDKQAPEAQDLWAAIRDGFALDHEIDHPLVRAEIKFLARYPNHLLGMRERLALYLPHVFERVRDRGFPTEIALLPIVESGMNPQAEALGGPAGLWQFIPATADRLGLPRNWWFDGRRDPALATRAALDYLDYLYAQFGDWRLAIVAYNTGEGTVTRALAGRRTPVSLWDLRLPRAGTVFVPKLLALAEIVASPERYGITLPSLSTAPTFTTLPTEGQVDVASAAAALGIDVETLYLLNPALNRTMTPPEGPHQLNVPAAMEAAALAWLANLDRADQPRWDAIEVRRGDTLGAIALRHRIDTNTLRKINNLTDDRLLAGQSLFVPAGSTTAPARDPAIAATGSDSSPGTGTAAHIVRAGETLWDIARLYRTSIAKLSAANDLRPEAILRIGQRLVIPRT